MKRIILGILIIVGFSYTVCSQENPWHVGVDLYNTYVFRGAKFGNGASIQPSFNYNKSSFTFGAWGSYSMSNNSVDDPFIETDLYATYLIQLNDKSSISLTFTDYYFPTYATSYLSSDYHSFEPSVTFNIRKLSLMSAYILKTKDVYNELTFNFNNVSIFAAAGNKMYTKDGNYTICNLGVKTIKTIKLSDSFSIPLNGGVVLNPSTEMFSIIVGISL